MSRLTADDLFHGAFCALEHAGRLLQDAVELWERGRYPSSVVLAVFAREEIGRYKILLEEREEAKKTGPRDTQTIQNRCRDHKDKLKRGMFGFAYSFNAHDDPELKGFYSHPGSDE
jgi:AbiV family abortive infection protein